MAEFVDGAAFRAESVTPSDTVDFKAPARGLYVGSAGNVVVVNMDGSTVTFTAVPAGAILPTRARRVNASSTTASSIVAFF